MKLSANWTKKITDGFLHLSISQKLMLGFLSLLVLLFAVSIFAIACLNRLNLINANILSQDVPVINAAEKIVDLILDQERYARRYQILKDPELLELFREKDREVESLLSRIDEVYHNRGGADRRLKTLHDAYNEILLQKLARINVSDSKRAETVEAEIKANQASLIKIVKDAAARARLDLATKSGVSSAIGLKAIKTFIVICAAGILLSVCLAWTITHNIAGTVKKLKKATETIANGFFDYSLDIRNKDELGDLADAFAKMGRRLKQLEEMNLQSSPLTRLPGGVLIEQTLDERIANSDKIAFCLIDIDNFKSYNDYYGYANGNEVIKETARIIKTAVERHGASNDFVGHIGGDDFVIITGPDRFKPICEEVLAEFDRTVPKFYTAVDRKRGHIRAKDRQGNPTLFPLASVSIAVVTNCHYSIENHIQFGEIAAELKGYIKTKPGSIYMVDRRTQNPFKASFDASSRIRPYAPEDKHEEKRCSAKAS